jgi:hypothetical protein
LVASLLHEHELLAIPFVVIGGFDKGVHDPILAVFASAVDAEMDSQVDGGPVGILFLAINTYLNRLQFTLFLLIDLISLKT